MTSKGSGRVIGSRDLRGDIVFAFGLAAACYLAWLLRKVLFLLYVSALAAVVLTPVISAISRLAVGGYRPFKGRAVLILLVVALGAFTAFGFLALPPVIRDLQEFAHEVPVRLPVFLDHLKRIPFADRLNTV